MSPETRVLVLQTVSKISTLHGVMHKQKIYTTQHLFYTAGLIFLGARLVFLFLFVKPLRPSSVVLVQEEGVEMQNAVVLESGVQQNIDFFGTSAVSSLADTSVAPIATSISVVDLFTDQQQQAQFSLTTIRGMLNDKSLLLQYDTANLEKVYEKTKDKAVLATLIQSLVNQFDFPKAYDYLKILGQESITYLDGNTIASILLNSSLMKYDDKTAQQSVVASIENLQTQGYISYDDTLFYNALVSLLRLDIPAFQKNIEQIRDPVYTDIISSFQTSFQTRSKQPDVPVYYLHGLLALDILQHGYFKIAQQISVQVLATNDLYILPYQILAYSHFVMNDWAIASDYFVSLQKKDPDNTGRYSFLLGISYFRQKEYANAVLSLKQSVLPEHQTDIQRYLALSYDALNDTTNAMQVYRSLLGQTDIESSDFYVFFEKVLFVPFSADQPYTVFVANRALVLQYAQICFTRLAPEDQYICQYGQAGVLLAEGKKEEAGGLLESLTKRVEKSYLFHALGDWYVSQQKFDQARQSYVRALSLSADDAQKSKTKSKLFGLMGLE